MPGDRLKDRVCLITGGSSGIGKAIAFRFADEGAAVAIVARNREELKEVASAITDRGGDVESYACDVADYRSMNDTVQQIVTRWGRLDVVIPNAGINGVWAPLDELTVAEWRKTLDINLTGTFNTIKAAVPFMQTNGGSVVVVSSVNGNRVFSNSGATAYATSKAGQVTLARMLALELAKYKIRVNTICPGAIETPIHDKTIDRDLEEAQEPVEFPEGKIPLTDGAAGSPDQVADVALFLASAESSHVTGTEIYVDGGESLLQG